MERKFHGTLAPGSESSIEYSLPRAKVPGSESSIIQHLHSQSIGDNAILQLIFTLFCRITDFSCRLYTFVATLSVQHSFNKGINYMYTRTQIIQHLCLRLYTTRKFTKFTSHVTTTDHVLIIWVRQAQALV